MDEAAKGAAALSSGDIDAAVSHYNNAITANNQAVSYYIKRSTANNRLSPPNHDAALQDAEIALKLAQDRQKRELIAEAQLRRGISLFNLGRFVDAKQCLLWSKALNEKGSGLGVWLAKADSKVADNAEASIQQYPEVDIPRAEKSDRPAGMEPKDQDTPRQSEKKAEYVHLVPSRIRHEWYQSAETVTIALLAKGVPKDKALINIEMRSLGISFPLQNGSDFEFTLDPLFASIDPSLSSSKIMSSKVEFYLRKTRPGQKWPSIEGSENPGHAANDKEGNATAFAPKELSAAPAYPTSSKSGPKNWDKVASDLTKKSKKEAQNRDSKENGSEEQDDYEGGDEVNGFFQKLYAGADPDVKRAMMKSYQESNGTALSTNWSEVGKKKVGTSPPDGMVAKKWGE